MWYAQGVYPTKVVYILCAALVINFMLFEVLDLRTSVAPAAPGNVLAVEQPGFQREAPWPFAAALARGYRIPLARGILPGPAPPASLSLVTA